MTVSEYFDDEPSEEKDVDVDELRKTIYNEFMSDLQIAASMARGLPLDWQLDVLLKIMEDI